MKKAKPKVNTSLKIDADLKARFDDWLWVKRSTFGVEVENLIFEHLKNNPLTAAQQKMIKEWHAMYKKRQDELKSDSDFQ